MLDEIFAEYISFDWIMEDLWNSSCFERNAYNILLVLIYTYTCAYIRTLCQCRCWLQVVKSAFSRESLMRLWLFHRALLAYTACSAYIHRLQLPRRKFCVIRRYICISGVTLESASSGGRWWPCVVRFIENIFVFYIYRYYIVIYFCARLIKDILFNIFLLK